MFSIPKTSKEMYEEIEEWILPQPKQIQTAVLLSIYRVYVEAKLDIATAELLDQEL